MVTQMVQAIAYDLLTTVKNTDLFEKTQAKRTEAVKEALPGYPATITSYLLSVDEDQFISDMEGLLPVLGASSVVAQAKQLAATENKLFKAILDGLRACRDVKEPGTQLAKQISWFNEASAMYARVFDRELQLLLLEARGEDSPIAQLAADVEVDMSTLPGVPSVQVQTSLLGGSRIFHNGELKDRSWRARLTKILSVVS